MGYATPGETWIPDLGKRPAPVEHSALEMLEMGLHPELVEMILAWRENPRPINRYVTINGTTEMADNSGQMV